MCFLKFEFKIKSLNLLKCIWFSNIILDLFLVTNINSSETKNILCISVNGEILFVNFLRKSWVSGEFSKKSFLEMFSFSKYEMGK